MEDNSRREARDKLIMEALIARRLATEKEITTVNSELERLRRQESILVDEIKLLDDILGAVPAAPPRPKLDVEQVHTILSPPPIPEMKEEVPAAPASEEIDDKRRRKGLRRGELADLLHKRFSDREFTLDEVVEVLLEVEPGDRRKAYHAAWRTVGILEESKNVVVVSETPSGKGVRKTYKMTLAQS